MCTNRQKLFLGGAARKIAPGNKGKVSDQKSGADNKSGSANGYVHGWDAPMGA